MACSSREAGTFRWDESGSRLQGADKRPIIIVWGHYMPHIFPSKRRETTLFARSVARKISKSFQRNNITLARLTTFPLPADGHARENPPAANMHLMYLPEANGSGRRYTLKKVMDGQVTKSAHPARFSPDDKWSRHRLAVRKRFAVLLAQKSMF